VAAPDSFPDQIRRLPAFDGPFDAYRLAANGCDVLFASYPAGTTTTTTRPTTVGVVTSGELRLTVDGVETRYRCGDWYRVPPCVLHSAVFDVASTEIELLLHPR